MEDEQAQKLQYINENLIEKGYNPEELSNFIIRRIGSPMEYLSLEKLKEMIEEFKDQSLQETYKSVKSKNKEKKETPFDILYSPQSFDVKTQLQQNNKLLELAKDNYIIQVTITDPKKEKSAGFFSKAVFSYKIECPELKTEVRRTYEDFEWLKKQLTSRYSLRLVPPVIKESQFALENKKQESEESIELKKLKYLNYFMKSLLKKKILRTSPILYEFLELNEESFKKYRDLIDKNKYELSIMLDNLKTMKGKTHCELKKEDIKKADKFNKNYTNLSNIYYKLDKNISNIVQDFQILEVHMKELGEQFDKLSKELKTSENTNKNLENIFSQFSTIFTNWSFSYSKQSLYFKDDFKSIFNYMNMEVQEMDSIHKDYLEFKAEYEDFTSRINKKKEELFASKDYSKWSLEPGTENQLPTFQNNKKVAFEKMLYKETFLLGEEKKRVACTIHYMNKQYNKLLKNQSEILFEYFDKMKENNTTVIGDAHNLIGLFSITKG